SDRAAPGSPTPSQPGHTTQTSSSSPSPPTPSSTRPSTSSCRGPRDQSFQHCNAASSVRISASPWLGSSRILLNYTPTPTASLGSLRFASPAASGELRLDLGGDRLGHLFVVIELHGEGGAPLRHGAQIAHVAEHVGERHHRVDDVGVAAHVLALDLPAARIEVADDRTGIVFRRHPLAPHDRPEQDR